MLIIVYQGLLFLIELIMFWSFTYFGYHMGKGNIEKYLFAIIGIALAIALWAIWAAPKSNRRIKMPYLAIFRLIMFILAAFLLYQCKLTSFAIIFALFSVATQVASFFLERNGSKENYFSYKSSNTGNGNIFKHFKKARLQR